MEYHSNFTWEKGNEEHSSVSLVLQHAQVCKKQVLLACVCDSGNEGEYGIAESGYFTEGLVEWFHRSFLKQCERKVSDDEVERVLHGEIIRLQEEIGHFVTKKGLTEQLHYWGILLWDNRFWIFVKGACQGYLVNRRFQRKHMKRLGAVEQNGQYKYAKQPEQQLRQLGRVKHAELQKWEEELKNICRLSGRLQRCLGILICTPSFFSCMEIEEAAEVLVLEGAATDTRLEKRLQELWKENVRRGETRSAGAIYLHT